MEVARAVGERLAAAQTDAKMAVEMKKWLQSGQWESLRKDLISDLDEIITKASTPKYKVELYITRMTFKVYSKEYTDYRFELYWYDSRGDWVVKVVFAVYPQLKVLILRTFDNYITSREFYRDRASVEERALFKNAAAAGLKYVLSLLREPSLENPLTPEETKEVANWSIGLYPEGHVFGKERKSLIGYYKSIGFKLLDEAPDGGDILKAFEPLRSGTPASEFITMAAPVDSVINAIKIRPDQLAVLETMVLAE